ncbi:MAG TPA: hypothetical protein VK427_20800, partial [Kofleriaceae bacterium]|nr:hypothetical protein [Kofleriaceae bacterium]
IIMKALAKDKEARYHTAEAFGDAILGYLHHRGKGSSPNDVSRWFDAHFMQEIEEHGARMRELISGRDVSIDTGGSWDEDEERGKPAAHKGSETIDLKVSTGDKSLNFETSDLLDEAHHSTSGLTGVIDELGDGKRNTDGDDDMPAERTRIEANPLEKLRELDLVDVPRTPTGNTPSPEALRLGGLRGSHRSDMPPSGPLPLPAPPGAPVPGSGPQRIVVTPPGMSKVSSGRFPDLSNLPTMIAEPDPETPPPAPPPQPELAPTAIAGPIVEPDHGSTRGDPDAQTRVEVYTPVPSGPHAMPLGTPDGPPSQPVARQSAPHLARPSIPMGYPVMDKEMRGQMAAGATVFPSGRMDVLPHDPQRAVELATPVGPGYGGDVDWSQAAAMPARAIPRWVLALLFVLAIGVALAVTIIIARLVR